MQASNPPSTLPTLRSIDEVMALVGRELVVTDWFAITQERIDQFAEATGDHQWIHVDEERSRRESPFGGTIAHGFLTLSLISHFYETSMRNALPFCGMGINYGLNRVRFTAPVRAGSRIRGRFTLNEAKQIDDALQMTFQVTMEIEGQDRPACVAESIIRRMLLKP